jgi:hypothetical protein
VVGSAATCTAATIAAVTRARVTTYSSHQLAPSEILIHGITHAGRAFRPSDWPERLCGVLAPFRPGGVQSGQGAHLGYSPYARPVLVEGVRCVVIDRRLRDIEPMAFDFALGFARDNDLPLWEGSAPVADLRRG